MKQILTVFIFLSTMSQLYAQAEDGATLSKKNRIEFTLNTLDMKGFGASSFDVPEVVYSRYMGEYIKWGFYLRRVSYSALSQTYNTSPTWDGYALSASFLPFPLLVENEQFNKNWELSLGFSYTRGIGILVDRHHSSTFRTFDVSSRIGISRRIYNEIYAVCNIDLWDTWSAWSMERKSIFIGLGFGF